jgi:hypothetical protein
LNAIICSAVERQIVLELRYHEFSRLVEPYVYGAGRSGDELLRCYQVAGGSVGGERRGWKLLRLAEIASFHATNTSFEPRWRSYNPEDRAIRSIHCRVEAGASGAEGRGEA